MNSELSLFTAFLAGVASFITPCILPIIPSYLTFITGISFNELKKSDNRSVQKLTAVHSLFFILGFTLVFMSMGALVGIFGYKLFDYKEIIRRAGGILIIIFGIIITGVIPLRFFSIEKKIHLNNKPMGFLGSTLVGITFAAGWSPCLGPIVGAILGLALIGSSENAGYGVFLLFIYSLGLGLPFLLSALAFNTFLSLFQRFKRFIPIVNAISGIILIALGIFLIFSDFDRFTNYI